MLSPASGLGQHCFFEMTFWRTSPNSEQHLYDMSSRITFQKHNRAVSFCTYVAFLAVTDNGLLVIGFYYLAKTGVISVFTTWECKTAAYFWNAFSIAGIN